jgi:hypothetical protein
MTIIREDTSPSASPLEEIDDCLNETIMIPTGVVLATPIVEPMAMDLSQSHARDRKSKSSQPIDNS